MTQDSTLGILKFDDKPFGFVIEDEKRVVKVKGETRIPAGTYRLVLRKELTPLTKKYRKRFGWFEYHIELENVPDFKYVYVHVGNSADDTAACQVIGEDASIKDFNYINKYSVNMFKEFYQTVYPALKSGVEIMYEVIDEGN